MSNGSLYPPGSNITDIAAERAKRESVPPGGGGPTDMEQRVAALEKVCELIVSKLDGIAKGITDGRLENEKRFGTIESRLTGIEAKLDSKAAKSDLSPIETKLGTLEGKVSNLPGIPAMITLVVSTVALSLGGAAGLAIALFRVFGKP